jgi:hypothetical protein
MLNFHVPKIGISGRPRAMFQPRVRGGGFASFDRSIIKRNWNAINRGPMQKAGNLVRMIARRSIKRRKDKSLHSPPGTPPFSHVSGKTPPFKMIFSVPSRSGSRVTIGMVGFGGPQPPPETQEYGRSVRRTFFPFRPGTPRSKVTGRFLKRRRTKVSGSFQVQARPFMRPALAKAISSGKLPTFWRNSLGTSTHAVIR